MSSAYTCSDDDDAAHVTYVDVMDYDMTTVCGLDSLDTLLSNAFWPVRA